MIERVNVQGYLIDGASLALCREAVEAKIDSLEDARIDAWAETGDTGTDESYASDIEFWRGFLKELQPKG